jgi:hypothetical protein
MEIHFACAACGCVQQSAISHCRSIYSDRANSNVFATAFHNLFILFSRRKTEDIPVGICWDTRHDFVMHTRHCASTVKFTVSLFLPCMYIQRMELRHDVSWKNNADEG